MRPTDDDAIIPASHELIARMVKVELHLHIEGTLEPDLMFELAGRNGIELPFRSVDDVRAAYQFSDLQSFLDIYYQAAGVLQTEQDFYDLTYAYLRRAHDENVQHVEVFFDPQTHTHRGVPMRVVVDGIHRALADAESDWGLSGHLILCILRHLDASDAMATLDEALPHVDKIVGIGLDSGEVGNPPVKFRAVFERARANGLRVVAHAGEEGPPDYIRQAVDLLQAERIDHGVRCLEDDELVERLRVDQTPLTVCPLSNVKLRVFPTMAEHPLRELLERGLNVCVNSDDPAYFGGYITENYLAATQALGLTEPEIISLGQNAISAAFLTEARRAELMQALARSVDSVS